MGGAFGGLAFTGRTTNIFSMIGIVMLMRLITQNAILLRDDTNLFRSREMNRNEAFHQAGPTRLRPILMTALSTISRMIPITQGLRDVAESRVSIGARVVGGMLSLTILIPVVIPVVCRLIDDVICWYPDYWHSPTSRLPGKLHGACRNPKCPRPR
ncbi:hypothetical protein C5Y93_05880 [Blastopirellula marina]|uniref:Uncharacterized protein n=1 Tax=Blastopirellula marina TaxID=124 RepID=A0A2S8GRJ6_9BACT|nr:hypothetical protein C5Y93_05880 [Blastopirellula marina]